jgi:hypothetical protein
MAFATPPQDNLTRIWEKQLETAIFIGRCLTLLDAANPDVTSQQLGF